MTAFDTYVMVDWSAAAQPSPSRPSADAVWIGVTNSHSGDQQYFRTRAAAMAFLETLIAAERQAGRRVLAGFDFPFGYPAGFARKLTGGDRARAVWDHLESVVEDAGDNNNNRFEVAATINKLFDGAGPFWGRPAHVDLPDLPEKGSQRVTAAHPPERRIVEALQAGAQPVWKLYTTGSVGSQSLLGLPRLARLARATGAVVWPFDTGLVPPEAPVVLVEVYFSILAAIVTRDIRPGEVKDAAQTRILAQAFARLDAAGKLGDLFDGAGHLDERQRRIVTSEEGWILGAGHEPELLRVMDAPPSAAPETPAARPPLRYLRDPAAIYAASFATVRAEARLDRFPEDLQNLVIRLIHSCGMVDIADRLAFSSRAMEAGQAALASGKPVLCDVEMVASGIIRRHLPANNPVIVTLNDPNLPDISNTRSAAAVELWRDVIDGAIVAIGNAPTALFHVLELLDQGWPKPALILGFPVGFVGAAESKSELAANPRGCEFITLKGRKGGSAMAAAAVNALAAGLA